MQKFYAAAVARVRGLLWGTGRASCPALWLQPRNLCAHPCPADSHIFCSTTEVRIYNLISLKVWLSLWLGIASACQWFILTAFHEYCPITVLAKWVITYWRQIPAHTYMYSSNVGMYVWIVGEVNNLMWSTLHKYSRSLSREENYSIKKKIWNPVRVLCWSTQ